MSERKRLPPIIIVVIAVVIAAIVIASSFLILLYAVGLPFAGATVSRNSAAYHVTDGYAVEFVADNTNLNVVNSPNGTVYLTVSVVYFPIGAGPPMNLTSQYAHNSVNLTATIPRTGVIRSTAVLYLPLIPRAGSVSATLSNGNMAVSAPGDSDRLYFQTTNGNIMFTAGKSGSIHLLSDNGNINIATGGIMNMTASTQNGNINFEVLGSSVTSGTTDISTNNGNVAIGLNPAVSVVVAVATSTGTVSVTGLTFTSVISTQKSFYGIHGTGSATLHATTQNGNIDVS